MRVQWKLFIILFLVGVLPLVLVASVSLKGTRELGRSMSGELRTEFTEIIGAQVKRDAATASSAVMRGTGAASAALRALALRTEQLLARDLAAAPRVYFSEEYDTPGQGPADVTRPEGYQGSGGSLGVSFGNLVFVTAPGVSRFDVRKDTARLSRLLPTCRSLFRDLDGSAYRLFVSLESGLTVAYPGFGGYPDNFDPRRASWYGRARSSGGSPVWSELLISRSTGMALFSFTSPVRGPDGSFAGVASIELPLTWFLQETELASAWTDEMRSFIVATGTDKGTGKAALHVLARQDYEKGASALVGEAYEKLDPGRDVRAFQAMADDIEAGGSGATMLEFEGQDSIWSYAPLGKKGMAFVLVVPVSVAAAAPRRIEAAVEDMLSVQWLVTYTAAVVLALAAALGAYLFSRRGAASTKVLVRAWQRLAGGDFDTRLSLRTGDERDELVEAFNQTVPKLAERLRLKKSVSLAREVQQLLLPEELPSVPGIDVAGVTLYCDETGGDYYDVIQTTKQGSLLVAVGDVSGHDVASALLMASTRALLRGAAKTRKPLAERVASVNRLLTQDVAGSGHFVTLMCLEWEAETGDIVWVRAGHEPGWLFSPEAERPVELGGEGLSLGFKATGVCQEGRRPFGRAGATVVLCTDGVFEAQGENGEFFGRERFLEVAGRAVRRPGADAGSVVRAVVEAVEGFSGGTLADDVTVVAVRRTAV